MDNKDKAIAIINGLVQGDTTAIEAYVSDTTYIQHNPAAPSGKEAFLGLVSMVKDSSATIVRALQDGEYVALHTEYKLPLFGGELVGFDLFRFEDGLVVEHWDNLTPKADPNPSGRTQTDGSTEISDVDQTDKNRVKVQGLLKKFFIAQEGEITEYISAETYIQHNSQVADGLDGLGQALSSMAEHGIEMIYTKVHYIVAEGNFVMSISEGTFGGKPTAYYDLFRLENGFIVEHWDVIAEIPTESANNNGKF